MNKEIKSIREKKRQRQKLDKADEVINSLERNIRYPEYSKERKMKNRKKQ